MATQDHALQIELETITPTTITRIVIAPLVAQLQRQGWFVVDRTQSHQSRVQARRALEYEKIKLYRLRVGRMHFDNQQNTY